MDASLGTQNQLMLPRLMYDPNRALLLQTLLVLMLGLLPEDLVPIFPQINLFKSTYCRLIHQPLLLDTVIVTE